MTRAEPLQLNGVLVAVCTPFKEDSSLDREAFTRHLEFLAHHKVQGFLACGTTGEAATLAKDERHWVLRRVKEVAGGFGLVAIAGCGSPSTRVALELMQEAKGLDYDAALVVTPYYNKPTVAGLRQHYETLATQSDFPIVLYNVPSRTGVNLPAEVTLQLMEHANLIGIKEASGHYSQWLALAQGTCWGRKSLLSGDDDAVAVFMALGGKGVISACANLAPKPFVTLYERAREGRWEEAFSIQKQLSSLVRALFMETNPAPVKFALSRCQALENYPPHVRLPLVELSVPSQRLVEGVLEKEKDFLGL